MIVAIILTIPYYTKFDVNNWNFSLYYLCFFFYGLTVFYAIREKKNYEITCLLCVLLLCMLPGEWNKPLSVTIITAVILASAISYHIKTKWVRMVLERIDKYSFCIYMVQAIPMQQICDYYYWKEGIRLGQMETFIIVTGLTLVFSILFYHLVDQSAAKIIDRLVVRHCDVGLRKN